MEADFNRKTVGKEFTTVKGQRVQATGHIRKDGRYIEVLRPDYSKVFVNRANLRKFTPPKAKGGAK